MDGAVWADHGRDDRFWQEGQPLLPPLTDPVQAALVSGPPPG
jgi:hypothetical protein